MARTILSLSLEAVGAFGTAFEWEPSTRSLTRIAESLPPKDMVETVKVASGAAVATLVGEYVRAAQIRLGKRYRIDAVAVSAPGTIDVVTGILLKSTRLGVLQRFDCRAFLKDQYGISATFVNDADASAVGEIRFGIGKTLGVGSLDDLSKCGDFAYVLIAEGVGCAIFVNGRRYLGGGAAGALGRMTIDPSGPISERFSSRGPLESYASREAMSRQIVAAFRSARNKGVAKPENLRRFDHVLNAVTEWGYIPTSEIAAATTEGHPLVMAAIEEAARYLGVAIGALITIMNPPTVILGGEMVQSVPGFYPRIVAETERFTWDVAWNNTRMLLGTLPDAQQWGAAYLAGVHGLV